MVALQTPKTRLLRKKKSPVFVGGIFFCPGGNTFFQKGKRKGRKGKWGEEYLGMAGRLAFCSPALPCLAVWLGGLLILAFCYPRFALPGRLAW